MKINVITILILVSLMGGLCFAQGAATKPGQSSGVGTGNAESNTGDFTVQDNGMNTVDNAQMNEPGEENENSTAGANFDNSTM